MIHLIALTSDLAATIFTGIPCTDGSHFDLPSSVRPGDWESKDAKRGEKQGHRRCKFPKKHVVVDGKTGEFAIVHSKYSSLAGFRMLRPTREILQFFLDKRLNISMASERVSFFHICLPL